MFGSFLDFIGLRKGMFTAVSLRAIASTAHAWMSGFWGFAVARSVLGFGEGSAFPAALKAAAESLPPNRQSRGTAIGYSGASLGAIVTPLIVTPIALRFGWRAAFLVTGAMGACWLAMWAIIGRPPYLAEHRRESSKSCVAQFSGAASLDRGLQLRTRRRRAGLGFISQPAVPEPRIQSLAGETWRDTLDSTGRLGGRLFFLGLDRGQVRYARASADGPVFHARRCSRCRRRW